MIGSLTDFVAEQQRRFDASTQPDARKERGHFGTPTAVADFMAGMFRDIPPGRLRVLDPGAGVGTLSASLCQRLLREGWNVTDVYFELWENDRHLEPRLRNTMEVCKDTLVRAGYRMDFAIRTEDFVLEHAQPTLFNQAVAEPFDLVITNPPYFKLRKDSPPAIAMSHVVYGQPNIYALFMAVAAELLADGGQMVAITPRSYFNGPYFKRFRKWFFDRMTARQIHVFESRSDVFREDSVLQESVIVLAEKGGKTGDVSLTLSADRSFRDVQQHSLPYDRVVESGSGDHVIRVAPNALEQQIIEAMDNLPKRFRQLPLKISTGPVVTFRSTEFLRDQRSDDTAPLFWMHNVRAFEIQLGQKAGKQSHILASRESARLLLPAKTYVLLKRFTAKEERRRLVAGILRRDDSYSRYVGLENHLNYVHKPGDELSMDEAMGLAGWFNSAVVDRYFRAISGNTQVNAAEIRAMNMPPLEVIKDIGRKLQQSTDAEHVERLVGEAIGVAPTVIDELCEVAK